MNASETIHANDRNLLDSYYFLMLFRLLSDENYLLMTKFVKEVRVYLKHGIFKNSYEFAQCVDKVINECMSHQEYDLVV